MTGTDPYELRWITDPAQSFSLALSKIMDHRRLFITRENHLGVGPESFENDDTIWLLPGAAVPFILRHLENGHFMVVGEAYVHGIMHGEALDSDHVNFEEVMID
jgi:hypothetical protein